MEKSKSERGGAEREAAERTTALRATRVLRDSAKPAAWPAWSHERRGEKLDEQERLDRHLGLVFDLVNRWGDAGNWGDEADEPSFSEVYDATREGRAETLFWPARDRDAQSRAFEALVAAQYGAAWIAREEGRPLASSHFAADVERGIGGGDCASAELAGVSDYEFFLTYMGYLDAQSQGPEIVKQSIGRFRERGRCHLATIDLRWWKLPAGSCRAVARPRARSHRRRRTSSSSRTAGADPPPGDDDDESEPGSPGSWLTFEAFHRLTPGCSGSERLGRFLKLSPGTQDRTWRALARDLEEMRG